MHERSLYYVCALFVALVLVMLAPVHGDGDVNIEGIVTFDVGANAFLYYCIKSR
jgi:hypothetical protein